jgi:hypothetical protein
MAQFSSMFTPNRRIDYYRKLSQALMPKEARAFNPNLGPYEQGTGTNIANTLNYLAKTYFAQDPLRKADRLEAEQRAAQSQVLSRALSARRGRTGESQYGTRDIAGPRVDTFLPSTIMGQPYRISDDGQQIPGPDPLDPELLKIAGTTPGLFGLQQEESRLIGEERSEKNRLNYATRMLAKAETADDKEFWLSEINAVSRAERSLDLDATKAEEQRKDKAARGLAAYKAGFTGEFAKNNLTGVIEAVSKIDLYDKNNRGKWTRVPVEELQNMSQNLPRSATEIKLHQDIMDKAVNLDLRLAENMRLSKMFEVGKIDTGALAPLINFAKKYLVDMGLMTLAQAAGLSRVELFQATANMRALEMRNPESGYGLTGNTSDRDIIYLSNAVIQLSKTEAANEALLIMERARDRRLLLVATTQMQSIRLNRGEGTIGSYESLKEALKDEPLLKPKEVARLEHLLKVHQPGAGPGGAGVIPTVKYVPGALGGSP